MQSGYCVLAAPSQDASEGWKTRLFFAGCSSSCSILPGLKWKEGNIIPSYRSLLPREVISELTTAKTSGRSIFCRRSAKPTGRWSGQSPVLQMCQLLPASH